MGRVAVGDGPGGGGGVGPRLSRFSRYWVGLGRDSAGLGRARLCCGRIFLENQY